MKDKIILGVGAHADDLDFGAGGTIAKWIKEGAKIYYLILTDGSKGFENSSIDASKLVNTREEEQKEAAKVLGVESVSFGRFEDGNLVNNWDVKKVIIQKIRELKPDMVITLDPTFVYDEKTGFINHPDHRVVGQATLDSVYPFARNSRTFPEFENQGLRSHIVKEVLLINFNKSNFTVDISDFLDKKFAAIKAHKSQLQKVEELKEKITEMAKQKGQKEGYEYAESFIKITIPNS